MDALEEVFVVTRFGMLSLSVDGMLRASSISRAPRLSSVDMTSRSSLLMGCRTRQRSDHARPAPMISVCVEDGISLKGNVGVDAA